MSAARYSEPMDQDTTSAPNQRDFWTFDRRSVILGVLAGIGAIAASILSYSVSDWLDVWPGGWIAHLVHWLAICILWVMVIRWLRQRRDWVSRLPR